MTSISSCGHKVGTRWAQGGPSNVLGQEKREGGKVGGHPRKVNYMGGGGQYVEIEIRELT